VLKSINTRVQESFGEAEHGDVSQYLEWVNAKITGQAQSVRRMVALIVLLIAIFELVYEYPQTQIVIGSFRLYKGSVVLLFIPAFVAFLYLQSLLETYSLNDAQRVYTRVFKKWSEKAAENQLDEFVMPSMPIYWNIGAYIGGFPKTFVFRLELALTVLFSSFIVFGVLAFEAQAYYDLFLLPARDNILWVLSVSAATVCCLAAITIWYGNAYSRVRARDFSAPYP
jgi:hypothetical protein